jgi:hypothetical protein
MSTCITGTNDLFINQGASCIGQDVSCFATSIDGSTANVQFIRNAGEGVGLIWKNTEDGVAYLRSLKSSNDSISIAIDGDEINLQAAGGSVDAHLTYVQSIPVSTVNITHNLGKKPSVTLADLLGVEIYGDIVHNSVNDVTIEFSENVVFEVYFN